MAMEIRRTAMVRDFAVALLLALFSLSWGLR